MSRNPIDRDLVEALVREALAEYAGDTQRASPLDEKESGCDDGTCRPRHMPHVRAFDAAEVARVRAATPARVATGRTGTRYLTQTYIGMRADHAVALDAVHSEVPDELPQQLGCLALKTQAADRNDYLLYPDKGRSLDDESVALLAKDATMGADIQLICGDGLSAWALVENGPQLVPALVQALQAKGLSVGRPLFVRFSRIGVQDQIGVLTKAKATIILVGERPGLGTGDSLSLYTAYGPKIGQDNAEKDCISNVRKQGIAPVEAASVCAELMARTFKAGGGGMRLVRSSQ